MNPEDANFEDDSGDEVMAVAPADGIIIQADTVDAVPIHIERHYFKLYSQLRWIFTMAVAFPHLYCDREKLDLKMFVRHSAETCRSSKLYRIATLANGGPLRSKQPITPNMFLHRMFRCKTRLVTPRLGNPYTVIDDLVERLTGPEYRSK